MKSRRKVFFLMLFFITAACRPEEERPVTPATTILAVGGEPMVISLAELAVEPEAYNGAYLQLSGKFDRMPLLICSAGRFPSPATWGIAADSFIALAGGFDAQLRAILPQGSEVVAAGRWQHWQGPVGCGKAAVQEQIWYLEVTEILSPSPLAQATATPVAVVVQEGGPDVEPTAVVTTAPDSSGLPTEEASPESTSTPGASPTPSSTPTRLATSATPTPGNVATGTGTPTAEAGSTLTATPRNSTVTPGPSSSPSPTRTPTSTPQPGSTATTPANQATATATTTQPTLPTATLTSTEFTEVDKGSIDPEELVGEFLDTFDIHSWSFQASAGESVSVHVAASPNINVKITILDDFDNVLVERNASPAGAIESLMAFAIANAGEYRVLIQSINGDSGSYAMMLLTSGSYDFKFIDILSYGETVPANLAEDSDHFWFFQGSEGQVISISVTPMDNSDLFLELYGVDGENLAGFIDIGLQGDPELLADFTLPGTGIYSIRVGEYDFLQSNYEISLIRN